MITSKKKLLVLSSTYPRWKEDPEPNFVHQLAKRLTHDFEVHVLCPHAPDCPKNETMDEVHIKRYQYAPTKMQTLIQHGGMLGNIKKNNFKVLLLPLFFLCQFLATLRIIRKIKPDVIHAHWIIPQGMILWLCSFFIKLPPVLITSHGADLFSLRGKIFTKLKTSVLAIADQITVVSHAMLAPIAEINQKHKPVAVISMGVDLAHAFTINPAVTRNKHSLLFVGRLVAKKGLHRLIRVLPSVLKQYPDLQLTVIGDGPQRNSLEQLVSSLAISDFVSFLGMKPQTDLPYYYQKSELFVAPFEKTASGDQEGLGLVLLEALGCGCMVLTSDLDACQDITQDNPNCIVFESASNTSLLNHLQSCLESQNNFDNKAMQKLQKHFSWDKISGQYYATINAML